MPKKVEEQQKQESFIDEEPIAQLSINKYDPYALKGTIDDCLVQLLEEKGFKENCRMVDYKILIGIMSILVTLASQFYKPDETWEWPKNRNFVILTVIAYWSL